MKNLKNTLIILLISVLASCGGSSTNSSSGTQASNVKIATPALIWAKAPSSSIHAIFDTRPRRQEIYLLPLEARPVVTNISFFDTATSNPTTNSSSTVFSASTPIYNSDGSISIPINLIADSTTPRQKLNAIMVIGYIDGSSSTVALNGAIPSAGTVNVSAPTNIALQEDNLDGSYFSVNVMNNTSDPQVLDTNQIATTQILGVGTDFGFADGTRGSLTIQPGEDATFIGHTVSRSETKLNKNLIQEKPPLQFLNISFRAVDALTDAVLYSSTQTSLNRLAINETSPKLGIAHVPVVLSDSVARVYVSNIGNGTLNGISVTLDGLAQPIRNNTCKSVSPSNGCSFDYLTATGNIYLEVAAIDDALGKKLTTVTLDEASVFIIGLSPGLTIGEPNLDLGSTYANAQTTRFITVTNTGTEVAANVTASLTGNYVIPALIGIVPTEIAAGATVQIPVQSTQPTAGANTGSLTIASGSGNPVAIAITEVAAAPVVNLITNNTSYTDSGAPATSIVGPDNNTYFANISNKEVISGAIWHSDPSNNLTNISSIFTNFSGSNGVTVIHGLSGGNLLYGNGDGLLAYCNFISLNCNNFNINPDAGTSAISAVTIASGQALVGFASPTGDAGGVYIISPDLSQIESIPGITTGVGRGATDVISDTAYFPDPTARRIYVIDSNKSVTTTNLPESLVPGENPTAIAIDSIHKLIYTGTNKGRVLRAEINNDGTITAPWQDTGSISDSPIAKLSINDNGDLYAGSAKGFFPIAGGGIYKLLYGNSWGQLGGLPDASLLDSTVSGNTLKFTDAAGNVAWTPVN